VAKVLPVEYEAVEEEPRRNVATALAASVFSDGQSRRTSAVRAPLERDRRVQFMPTVSAAAPAFANRGQWTIAPRASMADQHHAVEEPAGLLHEGLHRLGHLTGQDSDVHRWARQIRYMLAVRAWPAGEYRAGEALKPRVE